METARLGNLGSLIGKSVLVVEDDSLVGNDVAAELTEHGATVLGPFECLDSIDLPLKEADAAVLDIDAAVLDINVRGQFSFDLAYRLSASGMPVLFTTGYDPFIIPARCKGIPALHKPVSAARVALAIVALLRPPVSTADLQSPAEARFGNAIS